jgi:hypothetical protein
MSKPRKPEQKKAPAFRREKLAADAEAERCVLAYLLLGGAWTDGILEEHFSLHSHKLIWRSIATLHARGASVERPAVAAELAEDKAIEAIGGLTYLIHLEDETGIHADADITPYTRRLSDAFARRNLQRLAYSVLGDLDAGHPTDELIAASTEAFAKLRTRESGADNGHTPRVAAVNLDAVPPSLVLLNSLAVFGGRIQFESIRRRGPMIVAHFRDGGEAIWRTMTDLTSFARSQAILAEATQQLIASPSRKTLKAVWEPAAQLILQLAGTDRVASADEQRDEFRDILHTAWKRAECPSTHDDAGFLKQLRACQTHARDPHGPPPVCCVWHDGENCYVHQASLIEWLSTPSGRNRHYAWGYVRDALLLLDFVPVQIHRSVKNESAKARLWRGPLEILVDDESGE